MNGSSSDEWLFRIGLHFLFRDESSVNYILAKESGRKTLH